MRIIRVHGTLRFFFEYRFLIFFPPFVKALYPRFMPNPLSDFISVFCKRCSIAV